MNPPFLTYWFSCSTPRRCKPHPSFRSGPRRSWPKRSQPHSAPGWRRSGNSAGTRHIPYMRPAEPASQVVGTDKHRRMCRRASQGVQPRLHRMPHPINPPACQPMIPTLRPCKRARGRANLGSQACTRPLASAGPALAIWHDGFSSSYQSRAWRVGFAAWPKR